MAGRTAVHLDRPEAEQQRRLRALKTSEIRYRRLFETSPYGILVLEGETGVVVDANPQLCKLLDGSRRDILQQPLWRVPAFKNAAITKNHFRELLYEPQVRYDGLPLETRDGRIRRVDLVSTLFLADGKQFVQCVVEDVTERLKQEQEESARAALAEQVATLTATEGTHDATTGLANRCYLEESLPRELHRAERAKVPLSVTMLRLERFEELGARVGEEATDALLREVGRVIQEHLRKSDMACRYGANEFVLVLPQSSRKATQQRVAQIRGALERLELRHGDQLLHHLVVTTGVATAGPDGTSARELLQAAACAMRAAQPSTTGESSC